MRKKNEEKLYLILLLVILILIIGCAQQKELPSSPEQEDNPLPEPDLKKELEEPKNIAGSVQSEEPDERIILTLPFAGKDLPDYKPDTMIPLGETVSHGDGEAHTGIDFHWTKKVPIIAVSEGEVTFIARGESRPIAAGAKKETWDIGVKTDRYLNTYTELDYVNPEIKVGDYVQRGDFIGYPWHQYDVEPGFILDRYKIHWNFGYDEGGQYPEPRLCPMSYFETDSKRIIEQIWNDNQWEYKNQFPDICSGEYEESDK